MEARLLVLDRCQQDYSGILIAFLNIVHHCTSVCCCNIHNALACLSREGSPYNACSLTSEDYILWVEDSISKCVVTPGAKGITPLAL